MALSLPNRLLQSSSVHLRSRSCPISSSCFRATKRHESSSGPVRYIPGDHSKIKKSENPQLVQRSKGRGQGNLNKNGSLKATFVTQKMSNSDDPYRQDGSLNSNDLKSSDIFEHIEEFSDIENNSDAYLELMEADAMNELELILKETSDADKITQRKKNIDSGLEQGAEKLAIELLAARAFTELELQKKLRAKRYPLNVVDSVIASIKDRGLLNDGLYAESFSRSRWLSSTWGPRRIKQALVQKGVSATIADKAMKHVFEEDLVFGKCQDMQHGMSRASLERLYLQASKQWLRGQATSLENRKSRIIRWLQYRGFSWGVTGIILRRLEAEHPP